MPSAFPQPGGVTAIGSTSDSQEELQADTVALLKRGTGTSGTERLNLGHSSEQELEGWV